MKVFAWIRAKWQGRKDDLLFERRIIVTATDEGISASYPAGTAQEILWKDVERVAIETNDSGPVETDFWWLLEGESNRCCFPQGATGEDDMFKLLPLRFPGFRYEKFIEACRLHIERPLRLLGKAERRKMLRLKVLPGRDGTGLVRAFHRCDGCRRQTAALPRQLQRRGSGPASTNPGSPSRT